MAQYDHDGDIITYSPEDKVAIAEEIIFIDMELAGPCAEGVRCELTRHRCQLWPNWQPGIICPCGTWNKHALQLRHHASRVRAGRWLKGYVSLIEGPLSPLAV